MELEGFSRQMVDEAIRLYLEEAYGDASPPESVQTRLRLPEGKTLAELAVAEIFERTPVGAPPAECTRIRLRLGNRGYPHMKLGVDRVPGTDEWSWWPTATMACCRRRRRAPSAAPWKRL